MHTYRDVCDSSLVGLLGTSLPPPPLSLQCSQLVTIQYGAVSIRLACITQQLATKWGLEWGLEWNLNRASVQVTGSPEAFKDFRLELHQKMIDDASLLMRETATLSDVIRVLSHLPSLEDLSHHLHVNPPSDGLGTSKEAAILAVLKDWFSVYKHASQGRLVEVLSKMGIQEMAWGLLSPGVSGRVTLVWVYCDIQRVCRCNASLCIGR